MNHEHDAILGRTFREHKGAGRLKAREQKENPPQKGWKTEARERPRIQSRKTAGGTGRKGERSDNRFCVFNSRNVLIQEISPDRVPKLSTPWVDTDPTLRHIVTINKVQRTRFQVLKKKKSGCENGLRNSRQQQGGEQTAEPSRCGGKCSRPSAPHGAP